MKYVIIVLLGTAIGVLMGYGLAFGQIASRDEKIHHLETAITMERVNHLQLAKAWRRGDQDDIEKLIYGPIALEVYLFRKGMGVARSQFFEKNNVIPQIQAYVRKHPDSKLNELINDEHEVNN